MLQKSEESLKDMDLKLIIVWLSMNFPISPSFFGPVGGFLVLFFELQAAVINFPELAGNFQGVFSTIFK